jgi:hypothetical protein
VRAREWVGVFPARRMGTNARSTARRAAATQGAPCPTRTAGTGCPPRLLRGRARGPDVQGDRWSSVDWTVPVRTLAARLHVSRQRVYQVMAERGIPRGRGVRAKLLGLETASLTAAEAAAAVGCSVNYARTVAHAAGRRYRRTASIGDPRYDRFTAWLAARYAYASGTIQNLCTRCRRVERAHGHCLDRILANPGGLQQVLQQVKRASKRGSSRRPAAAIHNDWLALRRYAEFLRAGPSGGDR